MTASVVRRGRFGLGDHDEVCRAQRDVVFDVGEKDLCLRAGSVLVVVKVAGRLLVNDAILLVGRGGADVKGVGREGSRGDGGERRRVLELDDVVAGQEVMDYAE